MWAHGTPAAPLRFVSKLADPPESFADLEKKQHAYASGSIPRTKEYLSKTALIPSSELPNEFVGGFPTKKGPVRIERDGTEVGLPSGSSGGPGKKEL